MAKKETVFNRLSDIFSPEGIRTTSNNYSLNSDTILKTQSKDEYETQKLQSQQNKYLNRVWKKVDGEMFQKSLHYESTRIGSYSDFEAMEFYPEISAALDIFTEESTTINDKGRVLNVYSDSKRVKSILEDLFFNRLDIHTSLPMWVRNTPIRENSIIPLLDGSECTIKELSDRVKNGEEVWSYAVQDGTKALVPSKIVWCDLTRKDSELFRVTLDDGTHIDTTPDHEYMLRDGSFKRADKLKDGESLMPFYTKNTSREEVYNPNTGKYHYTDKLLSINPELDEMTSLDETMVDEVLNHKVISVVKLNETSDVYCLEAVGPNGEKDRHNFPVCGMDENGLTSRESGVFLSNCKYGDNFLFLNLNDTNGVMSARQLPTFEIERNDGDAFTRITGNDGGSEDATTKFNWLGRDIQFKSWQIAHFRLLGDDRRIPYGTSILEKARRIWKQLLLSEDAMLIYRITRAPERRVYKIHVGNLDDDDIGPYVDAIANRFKRTPIIDSKTGQIDLKYNQMANDQDFFIPVRDENAPNPIETLPGAENLDKIADIEYLQRKLFTALRVPKSFLGYEESTGDGKNLALQDVRFSRTINRIQQSMIQELNKIAILHLVLLGLEDELSNFTLTLNNPSTQAEALKIELLQSKVTLFKDVVSDAGNGFSVMSMTRAKREVLNWSDDEIKQDLLEQRLEKAASAELERTSDVIKKTGTFDEVDRIYGDTTQINSDSDDSNEDGESSDSGGSGGSGGFGGGGFGGSDLDFGEGDDEIGDDDDSSDEGGDLDFDEGDDGEGETLDESVNKRKKLIKESGKILKIKNKPKNVGFDNLLNSVKGPTETIVNERVKLTNKNFKINEDINKMIKHIDNVVKD